MRWVEGWQNQSKQGCGPPMGVSALLLVPSSGSITSLGGHRVGQSPLQTIVLVAPHSLASVVVVVPKVNRPQVSNNRGAT